MPGVAFIKAGTFDDTSWLDPKVHIYCDSKEQWTAIAGRQSEISRKWPRRPQSS